MRIKIHTTTHCDIDTNNVIDYVNNMQDFFSIESSVGKQKINPKDYQIQYSPIQLLKPLRTIQNDTKNIDINILITSARINNPNKSLFIYKDRFALISNYNWKYDYDRNDLTVARHILHIGMIYFLRECDKEDCVCSINEIFNYICEECENELIKRGYKDGIIHLKNSFNWMNQSIMSNSITLPRSKDKHIEPHLNMVCDIAGKVMDQNSAPLKDKVLLLVLHFLSDLIPFTEHLIKLGANPNDIYLIVKPYPYPERDKITHSLQLKGINVYRDSKKSINEHAVDILNKILNSSQNSQYEILIIEDGGYFAPEIHNQKYSELLRRCVGIVEQTSRGIFNDELIDNISVPILSVAGSEFKLKYESPEIGRVTVKNISRYVSNIRLSGGHAVLFGFGSIGQYVSYQINRFLNMTISVVEQQDSMNYIVAKNKKDIVAEVAPSFNQLAYREKARLIIGSTGNKSINSNVIDKLPSDCILVSTSSDQDEIDLDHLKKISKNNFYDIEDGFRIYYIDTVDPPKRIYLLAEGYPINFYGADSLPNDTIDPILTLLLISGLELVINNSAYNPNKISKDAVNNIADKWKINDVYNKYY